MSIIRRELADIVSGNTATNQLFIQMPTWYDDALCAEVDPVLFYPDKGESVRPAKKVCAACDVRDLCREYALTNDLRHGVWGGLSEYDRRKARHAARVAREAS